MFCCNNRRRYIRELALGSFSEMGMDEARLGMQTGASFGSSFFAALVLARREHSVDFVVNFLVVDFLATTGSSHFVAVAIAPT